MPNSIQFIRSASLRYTIGLLVIAAALLLLWPGLRQNFFASGFGADMFMPHGHCYLWVPSLVALHLSTDLLIGISYTVISITLAYLVHRARRDIPFHWMFLAFGLFIIACGATHFMEVWTLWNATYWLSGYVKLVTAAASVATAIVLPGIVPKAVLLLREAKMSANRKTELETTNQELKIEIADRKHTEDQLQQATQTLHAIFQAAPLAIYAVDGAGKVLQWNPAAERIFGWTGQEAIGRVLPLVPAEKLPEFYDICERVMHGESFADLELQRQNKNGSVLDLSVSTAPLRDSKGQVIGVLGITADITERKRAEEAQRRSDEKYRNIFDYATMGIYQCDPDGTITNANANLALMLGYESADDLIGRNLGEDVYHDRQDRQALLREYERAGAAVNLEVLWKKKDGVPIWVHLNSHSIKDEDGRALSYDGFVSDITQRKRAESELNSERRVIQTLFEQLPVGVLFREMSGRYTHANQAICQMLGVSEQQLIGMSPDELYKALHATNSDDSPLDSEDMPWNVALRTNRATEPYEIQITTANGEKRRISTTAAPLGDDDGKLFGSVTVVTDMTERYVLEDQLRQSQKMESIGTLAGGVAHDFNNLLTAILGYTQMTMSEISPDGKLYAHLAEVEKAGKRATSLTRQLLAFSRRQRLERKTINLNDVINDVTKMLKRIIGEDVNVSIRESVSLPPVLADPAQIEQVIMNLAVNARDAMPSGGQLVIETNSVTIDESYQREHPYATPGSYVQLVISDTGTGMDQATKQRIFEPFFTTKEVGRGTGLGLSMVYGIIKQHEGMIEVDSELGQGTSFKIYLRVARQTASKETRETLPPLHGGSETILVAEDEEALRGLARTILEELGYTVLLASDGAEAVEVFEANREAVSLLVLDIVMPRMGGREAYESILKSGSNVPALFMTGYSAQIVQSQFVAQNEFLERTGSPHIEKPYSLEAFGRKVREALDQAKG